MNPIIENRLPREYQMLWKLTKAQRLAGDLGVMIQTQVRQVRKNFRSTKTDPLIDRYLNYGNEGMWSDSKIRTLSKKIYENKRPGNVGVGEWISVEIECVMPSEQAEIDLLKFIRKNGYADCITIKNDGSIRTISPMRYSRDREREERDNNGRAAPMRMADIARLVPLREGAARPNPADAAEIELQRERAETKTAFGRELVITFRYGDWKFVNMVCNKLKQIKCYVNQSCGLHVHFDCRHIDANDVCRIGRRVVGTIPALKQLLPASRQENRFSAMDINDMNGPENRYAFVNIQAYLRHQTIEIRGHSGTVDAVKIVNWIRILKKIMDKRHRFSVSTVSELVERFNLEPDLVKYAEERYKKFHQPAPAAQIPRLDDVEIDEANREEASEEIMNAQPQPLVAATETTPAVAVAADGTMVTTAVVGMDGNVETARFVRARGRVAYDPTRDGFTIIARNDNDEDEDEG